MPLALLYSYEGDEKDFSSANRVGHFSAVMGVEGHTTRYPLFMWGSSGGMGTFVGVEGEGGGEGEGGKGEGVCWLRPRYFVEDEMPDIGTPVPAGKINTASASVASSTAESQQRRLRRGVWEGLVGRYLDLEYASGVVAKENASAGVTIDVEAVTEEQQQQQHHELLLPFAVLHAELPVLATVDRMRRSYVKRIRKELGMQPSTPQTPPALPQVGEGDVNAASSNTNSNMMDVDTTNPGTDGLTNLPLPPLAPQSRADTSDRDLEQAIALSLALSQQKQKQEQQQT